MRQALKKTARYWYVLLLPFIYQCNEPSIIGLDVQPPSDQINVLYCDTLTVNAYTLGEDSVRSDRTAMYLLGTLNDPVFGKSQASFCTQLNIPSSSVVFPTSTVVDSVVLSLVYRGYYGDDKYINPLQVNVFEINDKLYNDSSYYSTHTVEKKMFLGTKTCIPNLRDSVIVSDGKYPPHMRIHLDKNLGKRIIEAAYNGDLANNTLFTDFFKGILVESTPTNIGGRLYYFDLLNTNTKLTMYYTTDDGAASFSFPINEKCVRFNMFQHDYSVASSDFQNQLSNNPVPTEKLYLQSRGGTKINLDFPTINSLINPYPVLINKAELVFYIDTEDYTSNIYPIPAKLTLVKYREDGSYSFISDQSSPTFGGEYDSDKKEYRFNISRHIQTILKETTEDFGIALIVSGASTRGDRVVLNGMLGGEKKPRLCITYTLIK